MTEDKLYYSEWSNNIYPCTNKDCDFIGLLDAFRYGSCYNPCPKCGSKKSARKTGRFVYKIRPVKWKWLSLILQKKEFLRVEWHKDSK